MKLISTFLIISLVLLACGKEETCEDIQKNADVILETSQTLSTAGLAIAVSVGLLIGPVATLLPGLVTLLTFQSNEVRKEKMNRYYQCMGERLERERRKAEKELENDNADANEEDENEDDLDEDL